MSQPSERLRVYSVAKRVTGGVLHKKLSAVERQAIQVLLDHPGSTSSALSREAGWGSPIWLKRFGALLKRREAGLWPMEADTDSDDTFYASIVADRGDDALWTMKPDVAEAFGKLGFVAQPASTT